ncbi:uncharacterized protein [Onthophagus taurus]|uniref:uncharacterized protein n=1 Tax=Onthophagus taurus TaxID=166361 RepID=UPI0039BDB7ED
MKTFLLFFIFTINWFHINSESNLFDKLASGFKFAGKLLGIDHVADVSSLISKAFSSNKRLKNGFVENDENKNHNDNIFAGFLRIFGFDPKKIAAIGVNGIIFMAQLISSSLSTNFNKQEELRDELRSSPQEDPLIWILNNYGVKNLLEYSKNQDLSQIIIKYIKEKSSDEDSGCIQLLICKLSPFIEKMQTYLKNNPTQNDSGKNILYKHLPTIDEVENVGEICEKNHPYCRIIY